MEYCKICGKPYCKQHSLLFNNLKKVYGFSGSSPPEVFIGRFNYPNVNIGILSPQVYGNTELLSSQEIWHEKKLSVPQILKLRSKLIYGRTRGNIKKAFVNKNLEESQNKRFLNALQEIAMAKKSVAVEFKLNKPITENREKESYVPIIQNSAYVKSVRIQENPRIDNKVEQLTNDTDAKSSTSMIELEKSNIPVSTIIKILSAGLLGLGKNRKLVPTRWAITAVDDILSKEKLKRIKYFPEITDFLLFSAEYIGNHYEFLLIPDKFSFEVIEISLRKGDLLGTTSRGDGDLLGTTSRGDGDLLGRTLGSSYEWHDYESFFQRKTYAESVTGAYYANRLALTEYLEKIRKQCSCIVFREISPEYTQSMGVGILRQISREAFSNPPEKFSSLNEALQAIQTRIKLPITEFTNKSIVLKNYKKQRRLDKWF